MNNKGFIVFDAHCDTISRILDTKQDLNRNTCHLDLKRMQKYKGYIQFFAAWIAPVYAPHSSLKRGLQIIDELYMQVGKNREMIEVVTSHKEALEAVNNNKVAAFISVEGGEVLHGDIRVLRMLYRMGVRSLCLTWNRRNEIADGVSEEQTNSGLTNFGTEVVKEMNRLGMIIDVSHLSTAGFWDVIHTTTQPVMASHSNSRELCGHKRNLSRQQFEAIIKNDGMVGINFCPEFLRDGGNAGMVDIIKHIEYFMSLGGENHIGFGADFDGIDETPANIKGVEDIEGILNELLRLNYSQEQVEKIASGNFMNFSGKILKN